MREITLKVYEFDELSEEVQEKVLDNHRYVEVEYHDWWDHIYDMALEEGVEILSFNTHERNIEVRVSDDFDEDSARKEILEREEMALELLSNLDDEYSDIEDLIEDKIEESREEHEREKQEEAAEKWIDMLIKEEEYLTSDEYVREFLINNNYEFYENGEVA